eukprot:10957641-Heterocapsa_arctica.AAC.1
MRASSQKCTMKVGSLFTSRATVQCGWLSTQALISMARRQKQSCVTGPSEVSRITPCSASAARSSPGW